MESKEWLDDGLGQHGYYEGVKYLSKFDVE